MQHSFTAILVGPHANEKMQLLRMIRNTVKEKRMVYEDYTELKEITGLSKPDETKNEIYFVWAEAIYDLQSFLKIRNNKQTVLISEYDKLALLIMKHYPTTLLLKPLKQLDLDTLLSIFTEHRYLPPNPVNLTTLKTETANDEKKDKFLIFKKGKEFKIVNIDEVVYLYGEQRIVFAVTSDNQKLIAIKSFKDILAELPADAFCKINRQTIISRQYIDSFKTIDKVKIQINLKAGQATHTTMVSQDFGSIFRNWIGLNNSY